MSNTISYFHSSRDLGQNFRPKIPDLLSLSHPIFRQSENIKLYPESDHFLTPSLPDPSHSHPSSGQWRDNILTVHCLHSYTATIPSQQRIDLLNCMSDCMTLLLKTSQWFLVSLKIKAKGDNMVYEGTKWSGPLLPLWSHLLLLLPSSFSYSNLLAVPYTQETPISVYFDSNILSPEICMAHLFSSFTSLLRATSSDRSFLTILYIVSQTHLSFYNLLLHFSSQHLSVPDMLHFLCNLISLCTIIWAPKRLELCFIHCYIYLSA